MTTLTFEDFTPGHFGTFGPRHITREEILAFAAEFDPQPMHLDEAAASASMLKGLPETTEKGAVVPALPVRVPPPVFWTVKV